MLWICPDRKFIYKLHSHRMVVFFFTDCWEIVYESGCKSKYNLKKNLSRCTQLSRCAFFLPPIPTSPHSESRFSNLQNMAEASMLHATLVQSWGHCLKLVKSHQRKHNIKSKGHSHFPPNQCTQALAICLLNGPCFLNQVWLNAHFGWLDTASPKSSSTNTWKRNNHLKVQWKCRSFVIGKDLSRNLLV